MDLGAPPVPGSASFLDDVFSVSAIGVDPLATADQLTFVYQQVAGASTITARVLSLDGLVGGGEAGLMIRESLLPGSRQASVLLSGAGTVALKVRSAPDDSRVVVSESAAAAPRWLRLTRSQSTLTAFESADGIAWTQVGTVTLPMTSTVYVGLAVGGGPLGAAGEPGALAIGDSSTTTTARFDRVNHSPKV